MSAPGLGVLILVHKRHQLLRLICEQIKQTWPDAKIHLTFDRASEAVHEVLWDIVIKYDGDARTFEAPFSACET